MISMDLRRSCMLSMNSSKDEIYYLLIIIHEETEKSIFDRKKYFYYKKINFIANKSEVCYNVGKRLPQKSGAERRKMR